MNFNLKTNNNKMILYNILKKITIKYADLKKFYL